MTSKKFIIDDHYELLALHNALLEAKFCDEPNDFYVSGSPILANIYKNLIEVLIKSDVARNGEVVKADWLSWLAMEPSRREWGVALSRVRHEKKWSNWTDEVKHKYILDLFTPFYLSDELLTKFINSV